MTIEADTSKIAYLGSGTTGPFAIPWLFYANSDLTVKTTVTTTGVISTLALNVDYTLSGAGDEGGGSLTLTGYGSLPSTQSISIILNPPLTQLSHYVDGVAFPSATVEEDFDRQTQIAQRQQSELDNAIKAPDSEVSPNMDLPAVAVRAGRFLVFDANGDVSTSAGTGSDSGLREDLAAGDINLVGSTSIKYAITDAETAVPVTISDYSIPTQESAAFINATRYTTADPTGTSDSTSAIQNAIDTAYEYVITQTVFPEYGWQSRGGAEVRLPAGKFKFTSLIMRPGVSLKGAGKSSTALFSTSNTSLITVAAATKSGEYNAAGIVLADLMIVGNRAAGGLTSQIGLDLLRPVGMQLRNVVINSCGAYGAILREVSNSLWDNFEIADCGDQAMVITEGPTGLPSNANTFISPRILYNLNDGVHLTGACNGNVFIGGSYERNGISTSGVGKYQIRDESVCYVPNHFIDAWTEGEVTAHIYVNHSGSSTRITGWKHFGGGSGALPDRALIINAGTVFLDSPMGSQTSYKSLGGSIAPFQVNATNGLLILHNPSGSTVSGAGYVENESHSLTGLYNNLRQDAYGTYIGPQIFYIDGGAGDGVAYHNDNQAYPWYQSRAFYRDILIGNGTIAPDAGFTRIAAGQVGPRAGDFFNVGSAYNGSHLIMGSYHLWVDSSNRLRIKSSAPASDTDGTVVGTQT